jgi:hypothetical protein
MPQRYRGFNYFTPKPYVPTKPSPLYQAILGVLRTKLL